MDNKPEPQYTFYVDLDGVLADFKSGVEKAIRDTAKPDFVLDDNKLEQDKKARDEMWKMIANYQKQFGPILWRNFDTMPDAYDLWNYIKKYNPQILTATGPAQYNAAQQKRGWVTEHFGSNVRVNVTEAARDKAQYAKPNAILIDDKLKAINPWVAAGGIGILHTSAANTIRQLKELGL